MVVYVFIFDRLCFRNGIKSSAVCVYDVKAIESAFSGPFKHQKTKDSIWEPFNQPLESNKVCKFLFFHFGIIAKLQENFLWLKCEPPTGSSKSSTSSSNKYQLKHLSIQPLYQRPILVLPNKRISKLVVDNVISKHQNSVEILFIATEQNTILKYMLLNLEAAITTSPSTVPVVCHLEEIELGAAIHSKVDTYNLINNLVLLDGLDSESRRPSLLIATSHTVVQMPVANCKAQANYFSCLSLMDPYCIWDSKAQKCLLIFNTNETALSGNGIGSFKAISQNIKQNVHLHQHPINSCPSTNVPGNFGLSNMHLYSYVWTILCSCIRIEYLVLILRKL